MTRPELPDSKDATPVQVAPCGTHMLMELEGAARLDDIAHIEATMRACVAACGATLLHIHLHRFSPQGVSGIAVLAESHMSCHTWPEIGYGAFDIFLCGAADPAPTVAVLRAAFAPADLRLRTLTRGPLALPGQSLGGIE